MESVGHRFRIWYANQPRAIRALLTINVVVYLLWQFLFIHIGATRTFVFQHVALNPGLPDILFEPWQLVTYSFLHLQPGFGGLLHVLFNMLWMVWIGREYESMFGPGRLLAIYVYGAAGGALLTVVLHAIFPGVGVFGGIVHGASAAVLAIMMTVAVEFPQKSIALMFIGVVRLIHIVIGFLVIDLLFLAAGGTSVSAHLGGVAAGYLFARSAAAGFNLTGWADWFFPDPRARGGSSRSRPPHPGSEGLMDKLERWLGGGSSESESEGPSRSARIHTMDRTGGQASSKSEETSAEVDRILDKISESGYDSLTDREKKILLKAGESDS